eukprot:scaffold1684_cov214-Amphora_coffeaeformis.AAC.3
MAALVAKCQAATMTGHIVDKQNPEDHTGWCLLLPSCVASGYVLMSEETDTESDGKHKIILDLAGSQDAVVSYIKAGTNGAFPKVVVEYEDELASDGEFGVLNAINATIRDPWWDTDGSYFTGEGTHQVVCVSAADADIDENNLCFRSDVIVSENPNSYVIESNGCPDHANMQGSRGTIANPQGDHSATTSNETGGGGSCGGGCGGCSGCSGGGCGSGGCDACSAISTGTCDGGCDSCSANSTGTCSGECCSAGGEACSANSTGTCCGGGCGGACCGGCGGSSACDCGHQSNTPKYQHYTMTIPKDPGAPGEAKNLPSDVVGILTNAIILDSHTPTWSYDSCNGHSDKKGQYHYHIPPMCFMESLGISVASTDAWWITDDLSEVRAYSEMASQFPSIGTPSPLVGFALDGNPIYAVYDYEDGSIQRGEEFGGSLDECNGKMDSKGKYGYYITPDPPFAPPCLKGEVGTFAYSSFDIDCPVSGIENLLLSTDDVAACLSNTAVARSTGSAFTSLKDCDPDRLDVSTSASSGSFPAAASKLAGIVVMAALLL